MSHTTVQCPWCQSSKIEPYLTFPEAGVDYLKCAVCSVLFADVEHQRHDYRQYDYTRLQHQASTVAAELPLEIGFDRTTQAEYLLQRFEATVVPRLGPIAKVLDVGCGPADFLALVQVRFPDWQVEGMDPSTTNVEEAWTRHGLRVQQAYWSDEHEQRYDAITMFGNLMLHDSPLESLRLAFTRLNDDGILLFDVKNPFSATRTLLRSARPLVMNHRISRGVYRQAFHGMPWGVSQDLLTQTLPAIGFEVLAVRQLPGRNAALSRQASLGIRVSATLDRLAGREPWIEFLVRKPGGDGWVEERAC